MQTIKKNGAKVTVIKSAVALSLAAAVAACSMLPHRDLPDEVAFARENLYPEGIAYQPDANAFLVSSLRLGEIGAVSLDGHYRKLVSDPELLSVIGIKYDKKRDSILACNTHPGVSAVKTEKPKDSVAQLMVYRATDGKRSAAYDLGALRPGVPHFCNDIATDPAGNVYVTDSFVPIIYRISADGVASVFIEDPAYATAKPVQGFGFNGIVYHADGYLLVNHQALGKLLKVDLNGRSISEVALSAPIPDADGMVLVDPNTLGVVKNGVTGGKKEIVRLVSKDGWKNAIETGSANVGDVTPTTATLIGTTPYVIDSRAIELFDGKGPRSGTFVIRKAQFN